MSAQFQTLPRLRTMTTEDLGAVVAIENTIYTHPWTPGNFADSLAAGYQCWIMDCNGMVGGYAVGMVAAGEAHLLNLSVAAPLQRRGLGSQLLRFLLQHAQECGAQMLFLEVRASNAAARTLYARHGFTEIGTRRDYYPAEGGREDAVTMARELA